MTDTSERGYVYVLIRTDIPREQRIVQAAHAALRAGALFYAAAADGDLPRINVVLLGFKDERALSLAVSAIEESGYDHETFREPDMGGALTACATAPIRGPARDFFKQFRLYGAGRPE